MTEGAQGCGFRDPHDYIEIPPLKPARKAIKDAGVPFPDGSIRCTTAEQCDDGVPCTRDVCVAGTYCWSEPLAARCSDGIFCNGAEACVAAEGCVSVAPVSCGDADPCTVDACDEAAKSCVYGPRDSDGDGEADWHCSGGSDCDDQDPTVGAALAERCGDARDNDCDGTIDEAGCGRPEHDDCSDPLDVSAAGNFAVGLAGAARDFSLGCAAATGGDSVLSFLLEAPRDVHISAKGLLPNGSTEEASVSLRDSCGAGTEELACAHGFPGNIRMRALPAGRYYIAVTSPFAYQALVSVDFDEASDALTNRSCATVALLQNGVSTGGDFVGAGDDFLAPCGLQPAEGTNTAQSDLVYEFSLDREQDVGLTALSPTGDPLVLSVRSACDDSKTTLACTREVAPNIYLHQLPPGKYYVVLESPSYLESDFEISMKLHEPTSASAGDVCGGDIPLLLDSEVVLASFSGFQSQITTSCDQYTPDAAYRFVLSEAADVRVTTDAFGLPVGTAVQAECGKIESELMCSVGFGGSRRLRNVAAGQYTVVLEAGDTREMVLRVDKLPLTQPVVVSGNGHCSTAFVVPQAGGIFSGDTAGATNSYFTCGNSRSGDAVFRLDLDHEAQVRVRTEAAFDTLLYRFVSADVSPEVCDGEFVACNDDAPDAVGRESALDETLLPGSHYYVLDGFNVGNEGPFVVTFDIN